MAVEVFDWKVKIKIINFQISLAFFFGHIEEVPLSLLKNSIFNHNISATPYPWVVSLLLLSKGFLWNFFVLLNMEFCSLFNICLYSLQLKNKFIIHFS